MGNWLVATSSQRLPSMRNSFGRLLASQSTAEAMLCSIFAFFYAPMVFFNVGGMKVISKRFGMALNRMCAICLPLSYEKYFSPSNTKVLIVFSWVMAITPAFVMYGYYDCDFVFEDSIWAFVFTQTEQCKFISWNIDFYKDLSIVIIIGVVDFITVIKVHITNLKMRKSGQKDRDRRRNKEINFLKQAVLQGIVFVVELYTYFHLAWQFQNKWAVWALTTLAWNLVHCTDS
ncbi:hypothetical protein Aduo_016618 [Ancylostoma duodenale]